jgi:hypothetical protein
MTSNVHPSSSDLLAALHEPDQAISTLEHLGGCLACRVRMSRIRRSEGLATASLDALDRIVQAAAPLPDAVAELVSGSRGSQPQQGEIWRVGRNDALLVWVRRVVDDEVADVIPLVLDVELADQESLILSASATPLATEIAAMVALRTHVHVGAFINRIGTVDIRQGVTEIMTAMQEGRLPSGVPVGRPIEDDDDQRFEYRQALRDLLGELSPSTWLTSHDDTGTNAEQTADEPVASQPSSDIGTIKADLSERLPGLQCQDVEPVTVAISATVHAKTVLKVTYLATTVLVATLHSESLASWPDVVAIATGCLKLTLVEPDADAVALAIPTEDWPARLLRTAHMRSAVELPGGARTGPTITLDGLGLVDILCKHLDGVMPAWETTEQTENRIGRTDIHQIAIHHARESVEQITAEGRLARQAAKKTAWRSLPSGFDQQVAAFVVAITNNHSIDDAVAELAREKSDD